MLSTMDGNIDLSITARPGSIGRYPDLYLPGIFCRYIRVLLKVQVLRCGNLLGRDIDPLSADSAPNSKRHHDTERGMRSSLVPLELSRNNDWWARMFLAVAVASPCANSLSGT